MSSGVDRSSNYSFIDRMLAGVGDVVAANAIDIASGLAERAAGRVSPTLKLAVRQHARRAAAEARKEAHKRIARRLADAPAASEVVPDDDGPYIDLAPGPDGVWASATSRSA